VCRYTSTAANAAVPRVRMFMIIVGSGLSTATRAGAFTGKKARRLLVQAEGAAAPPWAGGRIVRRTKPNDERSLIFAAQ
jgi:hypothetical protein